MVLGAQARRLVGTTDAAYFLDFVSSIHVMMEIGEEEVGLLCTFWETEFVFPVDAVVMVCCGGFWDREGRRRIVSFLICIALESS
jgi:hypothetical protein